MYTPRPNNDLLIAALSNAEGEEAEARKQLENTKPEPIGSYLMCHHADVCCEALDQEGNVFQVKINFCIFFVLYFKIFWMVFSYIL